MLTNENTEEDQIEGELPEDEQDIDPENPDGEQETEEIAVSFGTEAETEEEPDAKNWVKKVREENREKTKRLKELERELEAIKSGSKVDELGPEPTLEDADIDYDTEKFKAKYSGWLKRKGEKDKQIEEQQKSEKQAQEEWNTKLSDYGQKKTAIKAADFDDAESEVVGTLNQAQQSVIVKASANSALLVYGLGKNPKLLADLAKEKDLVTFTWKLAQLEAKMQTSKTKTVPAPEKTVTGGGKPVGPRNLDGLKEKADRSGDYTEYLAAKRKSKG